jgi:hypothetical protein
MRVDVTVDQAAQSQGLGTAIVQALKGQTLPLTMDITMDPSGKSGTAVTQIDVSSVGGSAGGTAGQPQTLTFTFDGHTLTFDASAAMLQGETGSITGTLSQSNQGLTVTGTLSASGSGVNVKANWQVTKFAPA